MFRGNFTGNCNLIEKTYERLSDAIFTALVLALEQEDVVVSEMLKNTLEMAMTRGAGGKDFIERREFTDEIQDVLTRFDALRKASK